MGAKYSVEKYLDSLPDDVEIIDVSNKNLDYLPDLSRFKKLKELYCHRNKLTSLPDLPKNLKELCCYNNELTSLPVLPENLTKLDCHYNKLTSLPVLPKNLEIIFCDHNDLTSLPDLPKELERLDCEYNKLTSLPVLPEKLKKMICFNNKLTSLPVLPENLIWSFFSENPIREIICYGNLGMMNKQIIIWNNFRYLYYCLKYKERIWKIRERIIKKRYHPSYLDDLKEDDDLDEKLGEW